MSQISPGEVFTAEEVARAAGVPAEAVRTLLELGELSFIGRTRYISVPNPRRIARRLQDVALTLQPHPLRPLFGPTSSSRKTRKPVLASLLAHATLMLFAAWL